MAANESFAYSETKDRYSILREVARNAAYKQLPELMINKKREGIKKTSVSLDGITLKCRKELLSWERETFRSASWSWNEVLNKYRAHPKRFELSIWHNELFLCGAAIGKPTWSGNKLRLDFIEASPILSPLSGLIVDIMILAGSTYAKTIGATQLRISNPVNEAVKNLYLNKQGFAYDSLGNFCYKDL